ncbi:MAG: ParM/StbA family protein [Eubacteriales bacterium]
MNDTMIIGIDHGYGNIKTASTCFKTGVECFEKEPTFKNNLLTYNGKFYTIGGEHKEFVADKVNDEDFYILTLAGIAKEMELRKISSGKVHLAVGLPLSWMSEQKDSFKTYLLRNKEVEFSFRGKEYQVEFADCNVYPQGFSAIYSRIYQFSGVNILADIGNGTMNIMYINDKVPVQEKCFTEKFGVYQCILSIRENFLKTHGITLQDSQIESILRTGRADIDEKFLKSVRESAVNYVHGIFRRLREREYNPDLMRLYVVGGGCCLVKNFGDFQANRVNIIEDICATAKGYEFICKERTGKQGSMV